MNQKMFCYQCEQTAACTGCTGDKGVCGKTSDIAALQDRLTGALIGLAGAAGNTAPSIYAQHGNCRNHAAFHYLKDN